MSVDNSPGVALDVKREEVDPPQPHCCRGSGEPMTHIPSLAPATDCKPPLSTSPMPFQPRPFPPASLSSVPVEYIIEQLRNLAPHYWNKPETADCTIIVPIPYAIQRPIDPSISARFPPGAFSSASNMCNPSGLGRRATQPELNLVPRISLKLHVDYLSAHSSYLRNLFTGASPLDLSCSASNPTGPTLTSSGRFTIPANRLPRLLPCSPSHPVLLLPIPDPTSFHLLVHWMYFGDTCYIEDALHQGIIHWEGIARNVEYLGLSTEIKVFLGRWYGRWLHPEQARESFDDEGSDTAYSDDDGNYADDDSSTASDMDEDEDLDDEKEISRGRTRVTRPLSFQDPSTFTQDSVLLVDTPMHQPDS